MNFKTMIGDKRFLIQLKVTLLSHDQLLDQLEKLMKQIDEMLKKKLQDKERVRLIRVKSQLIRFYDRQLKNIEIKNLKEQMDEIEALLKTK